MTPPQPATARINEFRTIALQTRSVMIFTFARLVDEPL
jgi:hypothetical protein